MTDTITILATTDLHGLYYDGHITPRPGTATIARVREFVMHTRLTHPGAILLDAGDFMGGGIAAHWSNHIGLAAPHIPALMADGIRYDAMTPGNHDLDTGSAIVERYARSLTAPLLACNIEGIPSLKPYTIVRRGDRRIAVIGLATAETLLLLHPGARFIPAAQAVSQAVREATRLHSPDLIVGLFHTGPDESAAIAREVPGIGIIFCGHVHSAIGVTRAADTVIINPGPYGLRIARADITPGTGIRAGIIDLPATPAPPMPDAVAAFGHLPATDGPVMLDDLIHSAQTHAFPGAESLTTPSGILIPGPLTVAETFRHLPYDDHIVLLPPATPGGRPAAMTAYMHTASGDTRTPLMTDPMPLRSHLFAKYYPQKFAQLAKKP